MKDKTTEQFFEITKLPPQAIDLEEAILGGLLLENEQVELIINILRATDFYKPVHEIVYSAIERLFTKSEPIDILTVTNELTRTGQLEEVGGAYYISQLTNKVASAANAEFHARIIQQKAIARQLIKISTEVIRNAYSEADIFDTLDIHDKSFDKIEERLRSGKALESIQSISQKSVADYFKRKEARRFDKIIGIATGSTKLNRITGGWQDSDLIIVAARPSMGKTALGCLFTITAAHEGKGVLFDSQETSSLKIVDRLLMFESGLHAGKFKDGFLSGLDEESLKLAQKRLAQLGIYVDDEPATTVAHTRQRARRLKKEGKLGMIVVDYLQLKASNSKYGKREEEVANISRGLKAIAKEFHVPVIALAQLSRAVETRGKNMRPQLSDLRESGQIEQDADVIIFPYRPEYYGIMEDDQFNSTQGLMEIIIAKNREGSITREGELILQCNESLTQIGDLGTEFKTNDENMPAI